MILLTDCFIWKIVFNKLESWIPSLKCAEMRDLISYMHCFRLQNSETLETYVNISFSNVLIITQVFSLENLFFSLISLKSHLYSEGIVTAFVLLRVFFFLKHFVLLKIWNICVSIEEKCLTHLQSISSYIKYEEGLTFYSFGLLSLYVKLLSLLPMP